MLSDIFGLENRAVWYISYFFLTQPENVLSTFVYSENVFRTETFLF